MFNYLKSLFLLVAILLATVTVAAVPATTDTATFQQAQLLSFRARNSEKIEALENRASALKQVYCFISNMNSHIPFKTMVEENTIGYVQEPTIVDASEVESKLNSIEGLINSFNLEEAKNVCSYLEDLFAQHLNAVRSAGYACHWNWTWYIKNDEFVNRSLVLDDNYNNNDITIYTPGVYDVQIIISYNLINKMERNYINNTNIHLIH